MRPDPIHAVEHSLRLPVQIPFNPERRKFVRHHAHSPAWRIPLRSRSAIGIRSIRLDLRRRLALVSITEGTESPLDLHVLADEVSGPLRSIGRNDYPPAHDGIFSKFRHSYVLSIELHKLVMLRRQGGVSKQLELWAGIRTVIVYADDIESPLAQSSHCSQVFPNHFRNFTPLMSIDRRLRRLDVMRCPCLHFDKAQHIAIPRDQIDLAMGSRRPHIPCH